MSVPGIERVSPAVHLIRLQVPTASWEQWMLLRSDAHHDNTHADHALERKHLEQAKERGAGILEGGDLACLMQGRYDKRADQSQLREELRGGNYFDKVVKYNADFLKPYAENFLLLCPGNHETATLKYHETNITERIAERLKAAGSPCHVGAYSGFVGFRFTVGQTRRSTIWLARHHGYGGGGPVTRGTIQTARMGLYLPDASIVWTGHTHDEWLMTIQRERVADSGRTYLDEAVHLRTPGYKDEYSPHEGWHTERGGPPKPTGAAWLRFYLEPGDFDKGRVRFEVTRAK